MLKEELALSFELLTFLSQIIKCLHSFSVWYHWKYLWYKIFFCVFWLIAILKIWNNLGTTRVPNDVYLSKRIMHIHLPILIVDIQESALCSVSASKRAVTDTFYWSNQGKMANEFRGLFSLWNWLFCILFNWHFISEELWACCCCLFHILELFWYSLSFHVTTFTLIVWKSYKL